MNSWNLSGILSTRDQLFQGDSQPSVRPLTQSPADTWDAGNVRHQPWESRTSWEEIRSTDLSLFPPSLPTRRLEGDPYLDKKRYGDAYSGQLEPVCRFPHQGQVEHRSLEVYDQRKRALSPSRSLQGLPPYAEPSELSSWQPDPYGADLQPKPKLRRKSRWESVDPESPQSAYPAQDSAWRAEPSRDLHSLAPQTAGGPALADGLYTGWNGDDQQWKSRESSLPYRDSVLTSRKYPSNHLLQSRTANSIPHPPENHINHNLSSPPGTTFREGNSGSSYREYNNTNRDYQPQYPTEGLGPQHGSDSRGVAVTSDKRSSNSCRAGAITAVIDYNHGIRLADGVGEHHQPAGNSSTAAVRTSALVERSSLSSVEIPPLGVAPRAVNKDLMQVQELLKKWRAELTTLSLQVQGLEENWNKACMAKAKSLEKITESEMRFMSELSFVQREMSRYSTSHHVDEGLRKRCEYIQLELNRLKAVKMAVSADVELAGNQERDLKSARTQMKDLEDNIRLMKEKEQLLLQESVQKFSHAVEQHRPPQPLPAKVSVPMIPATDPIVKPSEPAAEASFSANTDSMQTDLQKNLDDIRELLGKWRAKLAASNAEMKSLEDEMNAQVKAKLATVKKLGEVEGRLLTELRSIESEKLKAFVTGQQDRKMEEQRRQIQQQLEQVRTHKVEMSTNNTQHSRLCTERLLKVKKEVAELEENIKILHEKERNLLDALAESFTH